MKICIEDKCQDPVGRHGAKGRCPFHYKRLRAGIKPDAPKNPNWIKRTCTYRECKSRHYGKGLCRMHWRRQREGRNMDYTTMDRRPFHEDPDGTSLLVPLGLGAKDGYARIDKEFRHLQKYNFSLGARGYAVTSIKGKNVYLHHLIIGKPKGKGVTDHINKDKLDNRIENLRVVSRRENNINVGRRSDNTSGCRGVSWSIHYQKWEAYIGFKGRKIKIGYFINKDEAIKARKEKELELYGRYL